MTNAIIVNGEPVYCGAPVKLWTETGLFFAGLPKRTETKFVCAHWTGGSNSAPGVFQTLRTRTNPQGKRLNLSVHFCVNPDGTIYQFCDADRRCAHAGSVDDSDHDGHQLSGNAKSIGIEAVNPAGPKVTDKAHRELLKETIHGEDIVYSSFTPEQVVSYLLLIQALCHAYDLPLTVPLDASGHVLAGVMDEPSFAAFTGVIGHFHLTERKRDPGLALIRAVWALSAPVDLRGREGSAE